jgi:hypothetical protein
MDPSYPDPSGFSSRIEFRCVMSPPATVAGDELRPDLKDLLFRSIQQMMNTMVVRHTIAQIIENAPVEGQYFGRNPDELACYGRLDLPPRNDDELATVPTQKVSSLASHFCDSFDPLTLTLEAPVSIHSLRYPLK